MNILVREARNKSEPYQASEQETCEHLEYVCTTLKSRLVTLHNIILHTAEGPGFGIYVNRQVRSNSTFLH
jgi:hypothetical protein